MIDALVFSKNRAAQLDLLLRTIDRHARHLYSSVTVLWTGSTAAYHRGYGICWNEHPRVRFTLETGFEQQTREWLEGAGEAVSFLVDDDVFYRDAGEPRSLPWSFRGGDYDYPFSLDGNVYRRDHVATLLGSFSRWRNPTELEHGGHLNRHLLPFTTVTAPDVPCLVGIPANRVSDSSGMWHMGVEPAGLNDRYLAGSRLTFTLPERPAAHAPLAYHWIEEAA